MRDNVIKYLLHNQILAALLILAAGWLLLEIRGVLIAIFVSYILMAAVSPYVEFLEERRVPKIIAVIIPYIITLAFIFMLIIALLPFFISQIQLLVERLPGYINGDIQVFGMSNINSIVASEVENLGRNAFSITSRFFGGVVSAVSVIAISFYLLLYKDSAIRSFVSLFPKREQEKVGKALKHSEEKLGSWLRGQIVLSGFIGVITWVVLTVLGVEFALPLAVIAGLLEIVPTIGPILSAVPAVIVALSISPILALVVIVAYFLIQLFENNILVPRVMEKAVGLNPIVIILGIIIGGKLLGIAGALLAIPFISLLIVVYKSLE